MIILLQWWKGTFSCVSIVKFVIAIQFIDIKFWIKEIRQERSTTTIFIFGRSILFNEQFTNNNLRGPTTHLLGEWFVSGNGVRVFQVLSFIYTMSSE